MTTLKTGAAGNDPSYDGESTLMWTGVECNVGIICACLPLLRPLLNRCLPWFAQRTARGTTARPTYIYGASGGSGRTRATHAAQTDNSWSNWGKGQNVIMSNVSTRRPESRTSSEAAITEGIQVVRKVDVDTCVSSAEDLDDYEKDRKQSHATSSTAEEV